MNRTRITIYALLLAFAAPLLPLGDSSSSCCELVGERSNKQGVGILHGNDHHLPGLGVTNPDFCPLSATHYLTDGNGRWLRVRAGEPMVGIYWKEERT